MRRRHVVRRRQCEHAREVYRFTDDAPALGAGVQCRCAFDDERRRARGVLLRFERKRECDILDVPLTEVANRSAGVLRKRRRLERLALAQTHDENAFRRLRARVEQRRFVRRALDLARGQNLRYRSAECRVGSLCGTVESAVGEHRNHQRSGAQSRERPRRNLDLHDEPFEEWNGAEK